MGQKEKQDDFKTFWPEKLERWSSLSLTEKEKKKKKNCEKFKKYEEEEE